MRTFLLCLLMCAVLFAPSLAQGAPLIKGVWNAGFLEYRHRTTYETVNAFFPYSWRDEFLGAYFQKYTANENTTARWKTVETNLNAALALAADEVPGAVSMALDSDDNAERAVLYWNNNEAVSAFSGVCAEFRVKVSAAPTGGTTIVIGLAGTDAADEDTIDVNAWFRAELSSAWLYESDDDTTDDDDNASGVAVSTSAYVVLRIDAMDKSAVKFFINGAHVGSTSMADLDATLGKVQPYIAVEKEDGTGVGTLLVDYVHVWGVRP